MHKKARNLFRQMLIQLDLSTVHFLRQVEMLHVGVGGAGCELRAAPVPLHALTGRVRDSGGVLT